jgi:branched-chain amino acid transport system substrate-binding protein
LSGLKVGLLKRIIPSEQVNIRISREVTSMKRYQLLCAVGCIALLILAGSGLVYAAPEPVRVGVLLDLTGAGADMGPKFRAVQELFLKEVGGKIAGRPVQVFMEDDGTSAATATDKARKLISSDKVHILAGTINGGISQTIGALAAEEKIPLIAWYGGHPEVIDKGWYFTTSPPLETNTYVLGKYAYEKGYRTVTTLGTDYVGGRKMIAGALQGFLDSGGKLVQKQWVPFGTQDFSPYLAAMKPADFCLYWVVNPGIATFPIQYREFGLAEKMPLMMPEGDNFFSEYLVKGNPKDLEGIMRRTSYTSDLDTPLNKKFVAAFRAKMGVDPDAYDLAAYETWLLIEKALEATKGDTNPEKLRQAIRGIKMTTPAGPVRISQEGYAYRQSYLFQIAVKQGKMYKKLIKSYPEQPLLRLKPGMMD